MSDEQWAEYIRKTFTEEPAMCVHCEYTHAFHANGQCLFEPTQFKKMTCGEMVDVLLKGLRRSRGTR